MKPYCNYFSPFSSDLKTNPILAAVRIFHMYIILIAVFIYQDLNANSRTLKHQSVIFIQQETQSLKIKQIVLSDSGKLNILKKYLNFNYRNQFLKGSISGRFYSLRNNKDTIPLKHVSFPQITDSGYYKLELDSGNYHFCPKKHNGFFDSVSTYDMIQIQKHILGIQSLNDQYQRISADVNYSGSITAADISEIRNLVLRTIDSFKGKQWLILPDNSLSLNSCLDVMLKQDEHITVNFRGIKIGDVNNLVGSDQDITLIPAPNDTLHFKIKNQQVKKGDTVRVDFYSDNFINILGFQFSLKIDTQFLSFLNVIPANGIEIGYGNFGLRYADKGLITTSWNSLYCLPKTYLSDQILFSLQFISKVETDLCNLISLNSQLTPAEAYRDDFLINNVVLEICDGIVNINEKKKESLVAFPNPVQHQIEIQFSDTQQFPVTIQLYNIGGQLLEVHSLEIPVTNWVLSTKTLKPGVYLICVRSKQDPHFLKFVKESK